MKATSEKAKDQGKSMKVSGETKQAAKAKDLEPCDKPQAAEASRLRASDEACDDGVK
jgi:hypothetical protein